MRTRLAFATVLAGMLAISACTSSDEAPDEGPVNPDSLEPMTSNDESLVAAPSDPCAVVATEGACTLVCDPDRLVEEYVPPGSCVTWLCELRDGGTRRVGGCHE
ncbi:MAG TPA: hypothetical protein VFQ53_29940 [Kofleriaceae bacterium]|nr:hypothetical protein [Kofleriaceae bacterium]